MEVILNHAGKYFKAHLDEPLDISLPLTSGKSGVKCFYAPNFEATPVVSGNFIGSTRHGGVVNFVDVKINPHGNGTHTECVGHISKEERNINETLKTYHFIAELVSVYPKTESNGDRVITLNDLQKIFKNSNKCDALIIRTIPNLLEKKEFNYSGTNPPFIHAKAIEYLVNDCGIKHLIIDLPSVDKEQDDGKLDAHKAFWQYPKTLDLNKTITELVFIDDNIQDGMYLLNLQIASFNIDASPSKPVLYKILPHEFFPF